MTEQIIYRFENAMAYPVLEHPEPDAGSWSVSAINVDGHRCLGIRMSARPGVAPGSCVALGLPPRVLDGHVEGFVLETHGRDAQCAIRLGLADSLNRRFSVDLTDAHGGNRVTGTEAWPCDAESGTGFQALSTLRPPVQTYRLALMSTAAPGFDVTIRSLGVIGNVRLMAAGLAR